MTNKMEIILHRANSVANWMRAAKHGWGIEVDIRTHRGIAYLSHDVIEKDSWTEFMPSCYMLFEATRYWENTVILDCKETGILKQVKMPHHYNCNQYAFTDLIAPDQKFISDSGFRTLTRRSKYENISIAQSEEYWIDYVCTPEDLEQYSDVAFCSYVVSPELHQLQASPMQHTSYSIETARKQFELKDDFIKAAYNIGFKGVCTHMPERYAEYAQCQNAK